MGSHIILSWQVQLSSQWPDARQLYADKMDRCNLCLKLLWWANFQSPFPSPKHPLTGDNVLEIDNEDKICLPVQGWSAPFLRWFCEHLQMASCCLQWLNCLQPARCPQSTAIGQCNASWWASCSIKAMIESHLTAVMHCLAYNPGACFLFIASKISSQSTATTFSSGHNMVETKQSSFWLCKTLEQALKIFTALHQVIGEHSPGARGWFTRSKARFAIPERQGTS